MMSWDNLIKDLKHPYYLMRITAAQLLCNLSKSDYEDRILHDYRYLFELAMDINIEVARVCIQSMWKIAVKGRQHEELLTEANMLIRIEKNKKYRKKYKEILANRCQSPKLISY